MKNHLFLAMVALISAFMGFSFRPASVEDPHVEQFKSLKTKFEAMSRLDIEEYLLLKEQKARYEKADEIMGKILQLMLYDFGIHRSVDQLAKMKEHMNDPERLAGRIPPSTSPAENGSEPKAAAPKNAVRNAHGSALGLKAEERHDGEGAKEIYRSDQVEDFLKSVEIPDFFGALRSGAGLNEKQVELLNGVFVGRAVFEDPKDVPWHVHIMMNAEMEDDQAFGEFDVRLSKNGKQFSRTRSGRKRGEKKLIKQDHFMGLEGDDNSMIINAYGDDGYFQLYYFPRLNEFHGLVYLKKSIGVFERKGVVHLTKR